MPLTEAAQTASLGRAAPTGSVAKRPVGGGVVVVVVGCVVLVLVLVLVELEVVLGAVVVVVVVVVGGVGAGAISRILPTRRVVRVLAWLFWIANSLPVRLYREAMLAQVSPSTTW